MAIDKNSFPKIIDTDSPYDDNKNAADAKNVTYIGNDSRNVGHAMPILGNRPAFDMGSVSQQNKIYRVYIGNTFTIAYTLEFRATNNSYLLFSSIIPDYIPAAATQIQIDAAASGNAAIITQNIAEGYFDIQLVPQPNIQAYRWFLTNDTNANNQAIIEIRQEAIESLLAGELVDIGGFDLLGDLFIMSTSQRNLPEALTVTIVNVFAPSPVSPIRITCAPTTPHGLQTSQWVLISGVQGITNANGSWSVNVIDAFTFVLVQSLPNNPSVPYSGGGTITIYPSGIGEIGVAQKNTSTQNWSYTRLLRSVEWNFRTKKQIDSHIEQTAERKSIYWTDDYNPMRAVYYDGIYSIDGALAFNGGLYGYDEVSDETRLLISGTNTKLSYSSQSQAGGGLTSGNKLYSIRCLTENLLGTDWSPTINPIPVYAADQNGNAEFILGDVAGTVTGKINKLLVTGILSGVFKYIELSCTEYVGLAINSYIVRREIVSGETMELSHTGLETYAPLIAGEVGVSTPAISVARNMRGIDNRLVISNIVEGGDIDLFEWAQDITHSILRKTIQGWGLLPPPITVLSEFQNVDTCYENMGYMINETYRIGVRVHLKSGSWTPVFFVQDIRIDTDISYPRRVQALPDFDLSANNGQDVFVPYIQFGNINLEYIVGGVTIRDIADEISFVRVELSAVQTEVIAAGMVIASQVIGNTPSVLYSGSNTYIPRLDIDAETSVNELNEWVAPFGLLRGGGYTTDPIYYDMATGAPVFPPNQQYVSFYSPDILYRHTVASQVSGQELIVFGAAKLGVAANGTNIGTLPSYYRDCYVENMGNPVTYQADELINVDLFGQGSFSNGRVFSKFYNGTWHTGSADVPLDKMYGMVGSPVIRLNTPISNSNTNRDFGVYYAQLYQSKPTKFPSLENTLYINCGQSLKIQGQTGVLSGVDLFGGDTTTQRTFFKHRMINSAITPQLVLLVINNLGGGSGSIIFSQNRINSQLRYKTAPQNLYPYNNQNIFSWLEQTDQARDLFTYDEGYTPRNNVAVYAAADILNPTLLDAPSRIRWSELKPQSGRIDFYRSFLSLNFKDLDNSFGEIIHHENVNGELFTLQPKKWQRQFFNTRGTLQVQNVSDVLIGDGSVMSRDGQTISNFGTQNKWAVILGKSKGGNDIIFWWDGINKMWMRFGGDGTLSISEIKGMENFAANHLKWVIPNDTPADGEGISGVWHQRMGEAIWFVRGKRGAVPTPTFFNGVVTVPFLPAIIQNAFEGIPMIWLANCGYVADSIVFYVPTTFSTFEQTGEFWKSLVANNTSTPALSNPTWEAIPHTDTNYYSEFSIAFNEKLNEVTQAKTPSGFSSFYTPLPMIAHEWTNGYVSPRPISPLSKHYEHNRGAYLTWYEHNGVSQTEDGYVELVINKDTDMPMLYQALVVNSDSRPYKISFYTQGQETFIVAADFEVMNGVWQAAIKNDITGVVVQPVNEQDTSQMFGTYIRVRFYFEVDKFNAINDFIVKFTELHRNYKG